jgi:hypothetical protein
MKNFFCILSIIASTTALSLETDQFITSNIKLNDSSSAINGYFQESINNALVRANKKGFSCEKTAQEVLVNIKGRFSISKASAFARSSPLVDRYPDDSVSDGDYISQTFYQNAPFTLKIIDFARTINLDGVYMGTDKLGHFSLIGMNYYKHYLKYKKLGLSEEETIKKTVLKGFKTEYGILGFAIGGVLSYADLEANYQGLMFALDMCRGENPILVKDKNLWIENPNHLFDVRNYFNPKMDESFNISFWKKSLYKRIEDKLTTEYCEAYRSPVFKERIAFYRQIVKNNLNDQLIKENILTQDKYDRKTEDPAKSCE